MVAFKWHFADSSAIYMWIGGATVLILPVQAGKQKGQTLEKMFL